MLAVPNTNRPLLAADFLWVLAFLLRLNPAYLFSTMFSLMRTFLLALMVTSQAYANDEDIKMSATATPEQVANIVAEAAKSGTPGFKETFGWGEFDAAPVDGGYRLQMRIDGMRTAAHTGAAKVSAIATIGDSSGGRLVHCSAEESKPRPGPLHLECEMRGAFHVEEAKPVGIRFGLGQIEQVEVTGVTAEVVTGGARSGLWAFGKLIPLLIGMLMLSYWFMFLRR